jgi:hypothetical protein
MTVFAGCGGTGGGGTGDDAGATTEAAAQASTAAGTDTTSTGGTTGGDTGTASDTENASTDAGSGTTTASGAGTTTANSNTSMASNASSGPNASVRVAHMSPDAPAVDVAIDGREVLTNVPFPEVSAYLTVPAGRHRVQVAAAGSATVLYNETVTLDARPYPLVATGEVSTGTRSDTQFGVALLADRTAPSSENASVRLAHVSPDAGPVDVTVNGTGQVLFDNVTFGNASRYAEVPGGNYTLDVRRATGNNSGPIVESFDVELSNGTAYTTFAAGYVTPARAPVGVNFEPIVVTDGLDATIRFAHMAPDAGSVSVSVNGQSAERSLPYSATTEYFEVPAGNRTVTITAANASEPLYEDSIELNASTNYTAVSPAATAV